MQKKIYIVFAIKEVFSYGWGFKTLSCSQIKIDTTKEPKLFFGFYL